MLKLAVLLVVFGCAAAQNYRVCISNSNPDLCRSLDRDGQANCLSVESRIDCAIKLARGEADFGVFNEEETLLLGQQQPNDNRVIATVRDVSRTEQVAFEAVAVVPNSHSNGLAGLSGYNYCHPGLDQADLRWSPRVLKAFENAAAALTQCSSDQPVPTGATLEEWEVERLQQFFPNACRPGPWSVNATIDANLKSRFPNLCSLCNNYSTGTCNGYQLNMGVSVAGVNNNNRHIQAMECLRVNGNNTVAYAAWAHVREFFRFRNSEIATSYALLCPDGSTQTLTMELLQNPVAPCAFVRQPWTTIVATQNNAAAIQASLRTWWPEGNSPGSGWQNTLFNGIVGGANARVFFEDGLPTPLNYTSTIRPIPSIDATSTCQPARRWCTVSAAEHTKCSWVRTAAYSLGIQPTIACQQRAHIFECLNDIKEGRADFVASSSNVGFLARDHYNLSPVKLVQNARSDATRIAAFVRESSAQNNISRFENLRDAKACFPEFGGIAYVSFVRAAHERAIIAQSGCDYARVVGEFFSGACAPGALDATHSLTNSDYNASSLCEVCKIAPGGNVVNDPNPFTCAWDYTNLYFGSNGSISCLANNDADVAFVRLSQVNGGQLSAMGLQETQFRALCRNNTLAATTGVNIDDGCLLSLVVDAEVLTRRNDDLRNALSVLLESLDQFFGYNAETQSQHINLAIFSPFDTTKDLLFKDSAIGFTEPSAWNSNEIARNSVELFQHLESCNAAPGSPAAASGLVSFATMVVLGLVAKLVIY